MQKPSGLIALPLFIELVFVFSCIQPKAIAAKEKCQRFIQYDGTNLKLTAGIHNISVGIDAEHKELQAATDLAQIFDGYQFATCQDINNLDSKSSQYQDAVSKRSEATRQLVELMVILSRYKANPDDGEKLSQLIETINSSALSAKGMQPKATAKATGISVSQNMIDADVVAANTDFKEFLNRLHPSSGVCAWDLISNQNKNSVAIELGKIVGNLSQPLNIRSDQLRSYLFMPCGDGRLHIAVETKGTDIQQSPEQIRVPVNYGFVGVAFTTGEEQIGTIPRDGASINFVMGKDPQSTTTQKIARRVLIEPDDMLKSTAAWVIAIPVKNPNGETIGVISISSDDARLDQDTLFKVYYSGNNIGERDQSTQRISSFLMTAAAPASNAAPASKTSK